MLSSSHSPTNQNLILFSLSDQSESYLPLTLRPSRILSSSHSLTNQNIILFSLPDQSEYLPLSHSDQSESVGTFSLRLTDECVALPGFIGGGEDLDVIGRRLVSNLKGLLKFWDYFLYYLRDQYRVS
jgi:hypothetical protein